MSYIQSTIFFIYLLLVSRFLDTLRQKIILTKSIVDFVLTVTILIVKITLAVFGRVGRFARGRRNERRDIYIMRWCTKENPDGSSRHIYYTNMVSGDCNKSQNSKGKLNLTCTYECGYYSEVIANCIRSFYQL